MGKDTWTKIKRLLSRAIKSVATGVPPSRGTRG
jgi:hypothetical protein